MFLLCYSALRRARETLIIIGYTNVAAIIHFATTAFFVTNESRGLLVQLERLHEQMRRSRLSWNHLMREKLRIRRQIRSVNFLHQRPLCRITHCDDSNIRICHGASAAYASEVCSSGEPFHVPDNSTSDCPSELSNYFSLTEDRG